MPDFMQFLSVILIPGFGFLMYQIFNCRKESKDEGLRLWKALDNQAALFTAFQIRVAAEYVHVDRMKELEARIVGAIEKLERKLDEAAHRV